ncbi:hypothetical protein BKA57DRAFT_456236 [Linnemannia elongata]|nr:hypothetical protein BKA57DRAFT_456236 [Linnemannia elongata]
MFSSRVQFCQSLLLSLSCFLYHFGFRKRQRKKISQDGFKGIKKREESVKSAGATYISIIFCILPFGLGRESIVSLCVASFSSRVSFLLY